MAVFGVGSIGCTPYARANFENKGGGCVDKINNAIQLFNDGLKALVRQLNTKMAGAKFTYIDVFKISSTSPTTSGSFSYNLLCCCVVVLLWLLCCCVDKLVWQLQVEWS